MKKIYLFLALLMLTGCSSNSLLPEKTVKIDCPSILFAKEHRVYVSSKFENISLDNIGYKANINNAEFTKYCNLKNGVFSSNLSILFVVNSLDSEQDKIKLPFYIAIVDKNNQILDIQYFIAENEFKYSFETGIIAETEVKITKKINHIFLDRASNIIVGFMLDKKRIEMIN